MFKKQVIKETETLLLNTPKSMFNTKEDKLHCLVSKDRLRLRGHPTLALDNYWFYPCQYWRTTECNICDYSPMYVTVLLPFILGHSDSLCSGLEDV